MYLKSRTRTFALAATLLAFFGTSAKADNFLFSFSGSVLPPLPPVTVTGEIFGLTDNSTGAATSIIFLTQPLPLNGHSLTPTTWQTVSANTFTETSGAITAAEFAADDFFQFAGEPPGVGDRAIFVMDNLSGNLTEIDTSFPSEFSIGGLITFTNAPEPSSAVLLSIMLLTVALLAKKRTARRF